MDELTKDPAIASDFLQFMSTKLKEAKATIQTLQEENEGLRRRNDEVQDKEATIIKQELQDIDMLSIACRIEQCKSKDLVEQLTVQLKEKDDQLDAWEDIILNRDEVISRLERKYARVKEKARARRHALEDAEQRIQTLQAASTEKYHTENDSTTIDNSPDDTNSGAASESDDDSDQAHTDERDAGEESLDSEHSEDEEDEDNDDSSESESSNDERFNEGNGALMKNVGSTYLISRPCVPKGVSLLTDAPSAVKRLAKGGMFFWHARTVVNADEGTAITFAPRQQFSSWDRKWVPSQTGELEGLAGNPREMFYRTKEGPCYAGTFQASQIKPYSVQKYRALSKPTRAKVVEASIGHQSGQVSNQDKDRVRNRLWSGKVEVNYLAWNRTGFNKDLFRELLKWKGTPTKKKPRKTKPTTGHNRKRKAKAKRDARPLKKAKSK